MRDGGMGGTDMECPSCKKTFRTYIQGAYGKICPECRTDFGIRNAIEAQEMLEILAGEGETGLKELARNRVRPGARHERQGLLPSSIDPVKLAEITRAMTDYGVLAPLPEILPKPTTYAIAKNGLFEVRDSDIARIVIQPKDVVGLTETLTPGVTLHLPKVPYAMLQHTVVFFREVCVKMHGTSEALVQIWWNRADRTYQMHVPEQSVSGGGVNHRSEFDKENERDAAGASIWLHVMDIHSHGSSMSAFWSGTDDADERKASEGRMFGVIGKVNQPLPEWRWRMRTREGFIELKVTDVFDVTTDHEVPFVVTWKVILDASAEKDGVSGDGRVRLLCPVDPFKDATCPQAWHEQVKGHSWGGGRSGMGFSMGHSRPLGGHSQRVPMYIFVLTKDDLLEEFAVDAEGKDAPVATGRKVIWKRDEGHVH